MQASAHDDPVFLGFGQQIESEELYRLRSQYLPLGKIGGKPSWLNPKNLPPIEQLECKLCKRVMCFMMQVYATDNNDPVHSFHRTLFFFLCRNPECSKPNDPSNMAVFRCCLSRDNPYYSKDGPMDADMEGDVPDPRYPDDAPKLCHICGCEAKKKCGKCGNVWYCCRDHQALDWNTGHKAKCGEPAQATQSDTVENPPNRFLFKEMGIEMDREYVPGDIFEDISDDENDSEDDDDSHRRLAEFKKYMDKMKTKDGAADVEALASGGAEGEEEEVKDMEFDRFHRLIELDPIQVLRYRRGGRPLVATMKAPPLPTPTPCEICQSPRTFEMQLTPHLLSFLGVDSVGQSIDWASVYVFTCKNSCQIPDDGYAREFLAKQDFVE